MTNSHQYPLSASEAMQKAARACTDPLWIQHRFLATGHGTHLPNGTATFIKLEGKHYIVTCEHVASESKGDNVPALMIDKNAVINIANYNNAGEYVQNFRFPDKNTIDIAIYRLTDYHWSLLVEKKSKIAIDLDYWREPAWNGQFSYAAVGYPAEHKYDHDGQLVAAPMAFCVAEPSSDIRPDKPTFVLHSELPAPHGWYFSGMSGGPVFQISDDHKLLPSGIIFEGGPSSSVPGRESTYAKSNELFFRGHTLTPNIFSEWLRKAGL
jgi:Trypsin-like peptidase domain